MATQQDVIKKFMASLDKTTLSGTAALDEAVKACSNFSSAQDVINNLLADRAKVTSGDDFLKRYCGIILDNADTGAITGSDAGGSKIKDYDTIIPNGKFDTSFNKNSFTKRGVTFKLVKTYNGSEIEFNTLTDKQKHIWQAIYSFWAEEALKLIEESYGYSFNDADAKATNIHFYFDNDPNANTGLTANEVQTGSNGEKYIYMYIGIYKFEGISKNDLNGKHPTWLDYYLDRLFTHAIMTAKVDNFYKLPKIIIEGTAELTVGIDDTQKPNIKEAVASKTMLEKLLVLQDTQNKVEGVGNPDYVGGYIFLRYLAKQVAEQGLNITNFKNNTLISGAQYSDTVKNTGNNVTINSGAGNDSVTNSGKQVTIYAGDGIDTITNNAQATIYGDAGNDSITNNGKQSTINGGADDDNISNTSLGSNAVLNGGTGNDYIFNSGTKVTIYSSAGNDSITNNAQATIYGDAGNDTISNTASSVQIHAGDSNDSIHNASSANYVTIEGDEGKDTIHNFEGNYAYLIGGQGDDSIYNKSWYSTINGGEGNDTIINFDVGKKTSINGGNGNDIISLSGTNFGGITINGGAGNDSITLSDGNNFVQYTSVNGNDIIYGVTKNDTLQITGGKYSTVKSGKDLKVSVGSGSILLKDAANISVNIVGTIEGGGSTESLPAGLSIKKSVLTASTKFTGSQINLADFDATKVNASALKNAVSIIGDSSANSIKGGKGADTLRGGSGNDTLIGGAGKDIFIYSGGNDLISDYKPGEDKISASYTSSSVKGSDVILTTSNGNLTIKGAKDKVVTFTDGSEKIFFGDTSYAPLETGLKYDAKRILLTADTKFTGSQINLENYLATKVNASALKNAVSITGDSSANSIKGGKGADTLRGGAGNDTLTGGAGKDIFIYSSGNDLISDYKPGEDKISASYTSSSVKGSDVILTTSNGNLTIKGAKDKVVTFTDGSEKIFFGDTSYAPLETGLKYDAKRILLTADTKFTGSQINLENYLATKVNASALKNSVEIIGDSSANSLKGGKGADTLRGGSGNDTLTGGAGNDIFIYSGGKDIITDYAAGDEIIIGGTISQTSYSGKNVVFTIGNGSLTVKNGKGKNISVANSRTLNLLEDNNFISDVAQISDITAPKISVTQIQETNYAALEQNNKTFLTFAKK